MTIYKILFSKIDSTYMAVKGVVQGCPRFKHGQHHAFGSADFVGEPGERKEVVVVVEEEEEEEEKENTIDQLLLNLSNCVSVLCSYLSRSGSGFTAQMRVDTSLYA